MNDVDRAQWVDNDEGLYDRWKASGKTKRDWIRENRIMLDQVIGHVTSGRKPAHHLKYGDKNE